MLPDGSGVAAAGHAYPRTPMPWLALSRLRRADGGQAITDRPLPSAASQQTLSPPDERRRVAPHALRSGGRNAPPRGGGGMARHSAISKSVCTSAAPAGDRAAEDPAFSAGEV